MTQGQILMKIPNTNFWKDKQMDNHRQGQIYMPAQLRWGHKNAQINMHTQIMN